MLRVPSLISSSIALCWLSLAACDAPAGGDPISEEWNEEGSTDQGVTCSPTLTYYPVRGRHNNGYDVNAGNSSLWTCNADRSNSDFVPGDHLGNDIWAAEGTPVVATRSGTATLTGFSSYSGNKVTIVDSCGWSHFYCHLKSIAPGVTDGKFIPAGTVIGYVGKTGTASNGVVHLHYSIYPDGNYNSGVSPYPYLRAVESDVCNLPLADQRMQLLLHTSTGLFHTIRTDTAWTGFGNVLGETGALGGITRIAEGGVGGDSHVLAVANDTIYHAIRRSAGSWTSWGNVENESGQLTGVTAVAAAGVGGTLHVLAVANDTIYHAVRPASGPWSSWGNAETPNGQLTNVTAIAAAEVGGALHVLVVANDILYHAIRPASGPWTGWGNVENESGALSNLTAVAATGVGGQLQTVVVANDNVYHTLRSSTAWTPWGNVDSVVGPLTGITSVAVADVNNELQLIAISASGVTHTIRRATGWTAWGNVSSVVAGESGTPLRVAAAGT